MNAKRKKFIQRVGFDEFFKSEKSSGNVPEKSLTASQHAREEANVLFRSLAAKGRDYNIHKQILFLYNKSIALAQDGSEELACAYSNRSALLKHLKKFKESIIDIDRALNITKSKVLEKKLETRKKECSKLIEDVYQNPNKYKDPLDNLSNAALDLMLQFSNIHEPELPNTTQNQMKKLESLKISASKHIPSIANSIAIQYDETNGRNMLATKDIRPGEAIVIEKAFALYPGDHQQFVSCTHCLNLAWNGVPCDSCACVIYCSDKCKQESWEEYHKSECSMLPFVYGKGLKDNDLTIMMLITRCFIKAVKIEGLLNVINDAQAIDKNLNREKLLDEKNFCYGKFGFIYKLTNHSNSNTKVKINNDDNEFICSMILSLLHMYTNIFNDIKNHKDCDDQKLFVKKLLLKLKNFLDNNIYCFQTRARLHCKCTDPKICLKSCDKLLGFNIAPACTFFNHSCSPNVAKLLTVGGKIIVHTLLPIKKGDQLYLCYGLPMADKKENRQFCLKEYYNIDCNCQACIENWPIMDLKFSFQDLLIGRSTKAAELKKICIEEKLSFRALFNLDRDVYSEKVLNDNVKLVELIYKNQKSHIVANAFASKSKFLIEECFAELYGVDCKSLK